MAANNIYLRDGLNESLWQAAVHPVESATQDLSNTFDTVIVGAGITGITTALLLQKAGQKCLVIEAGNIGFGTTGGTSAHLNTFFDSTYPEIESKFSKHVAIQVASSGKEALAMIQSFVDEYQIACDFEFKDGYLYAENDKESKQLAEIFKSSRNAGITVTESEINDVPVPFKTAIRFENQGQFDPIKYVNALAKAFTDLGGTILEHTFVSESKNEEGLNVIMAGSLTIKATHLFYATHTPPGITTFSFRCAPYRSYVLGVKLKNDEYPSGLVYDMQEPYHYFRTHGIDGQKYLVIGGEDHKTGHDDPGKAFEELENYLRKYYEVDEITYKWSSQYYVPVDGLPYIGTTGSADDHLYIATGFNGNGMMFGTLSAKIISDQILGIENQYAEIYSPSRIKPIAGFSEFVKENADVAYHFIADRFGSDDLDAAAQLKNGEGKIMEYDGKKLAIHKDYNGKVTALTPICTHAGCIVTFNATEQSWDCPCHGARFDVSGNVISGPAQTALTRVNTPLT